MVNGYRYARATDTHVLVSGELAQVLERDTVSGMAMLKVNFCKPQGPNRSQVEWVYAARAVPVP